MITSLSISGFKTFRDFRIELSPFVVIAGSNGAGKSNLFDAIQLLSKLAQDDLRSSFQNLRGTPQELFTLAPDGVYGDKMEFVVEMLVDQQVKDKWGMKKTLKYTRLRYTLSIVRRPDDRGLDRLYVEREALVPIKKMEDDWYRRRVGNNFWRPSLRVGRTKEYIYTGEKNGVPTIFLRQDGTRGGRPSPAEEVERTVLSSISTVEFPHAFAAKEELMNLMFLQLNPVRLREPSNFLAEPHITTDGSNLSATLARLKSEDTTILSDIGRELSHFIPNITGIGVAEDQSTKQFIIQAQTADGKQFSSRVLSEGTLRLLALATIKYDDLFKGVLCFEEPENGIHPSRINIMIDLLSSLATKLREEEESSFPLRQVLVNTHSPVMVGELFKSGSNLHTTVFFAQLVSRIDPTSKSKSQYTKITPVVYGEPELDFHLSQAEEKIGHTEVIKYLNTVDFRGVEM